MAGACTQRDGLANRGSACSSGFVRGLGSRRHRRGGRGLLAALVLLAGCEAVEKIEDSFRDMTPREAYRASLEAAGLGSTALARDWDAAGSAALDDPIPVSAPFEEEGFITPEAPSAVAYRIHIARGRALTFSVRLESPTGPAGPDAPADGAPTRLFIDLFRLPADTTDPPRPVVSSDSLDHTFVHEDPWRDGEYVLRVQPELLRGGRFRVTVAQEAVMAFPVEGHAPRSILSFFGADRDGGRRVHHGVDIFARRGTPVLAATAGEADRIRTTNLGGKVVWIRDHQREASFYYAHLDSQYVRDGQMVERGDTIGFVGNTGNARTTPPHLHFGVYLRGRERGRRRGPIDPFPYLVPPPSRAPELTASLELLGEHVRPRNEGIRLRAGPGRGEEVLRELAPGDRLRVVGASGDWFRVRQDGGASGYVAARLTERARVETRAVEELSPED